LILIGLGFKVAAAPFQVWTPDVYEGAPTPVTALSPPDQKQPRSLCSSASLRRSRRDSLLVLGILGHCCGHHVLGNLGALVQTNVKRLLAYSSIAHAGYILVAFRCCHFHGAEKSLTPRRLMPLFSFIS